MQFQVVEEMHLCVFEVLPVLAEPKVVASCIVQAGKNPVPKAPSFGCPIQVSLAIRLDLLQRHTNPTIRSLREAKNLTVKVLARWAG